MGLRDRRELYVKLESIRQRPLIVYVTSSRGGALGHMAGDVVAEFLAQLEALPKDAKALDLMIVSQGGDPTVAWRIVSLIRERVDEFSVLVPQAAFSAATLIALGANEILMHPNGNLGPVDPQISARARQKGEQDLHFGSEDLAAFLRFCKEQVGITNQREMFEAFRVFSEEVGAIQIGVAARSAQLSVSLGEKLLKLHMIDDEKGDAKRIAETLNRDFFHHGYPVSRTEAKEIGLPVADRSSDVEELLWRIWSDMEEELQIRSPFSPTSILAKDQGCAPLFAPAPQVSMPTNLPAPLAQQAYQQILATAVSIQEVAPVAFELVHALLESPRTASRFVSEGTILAARLPDLQMRVNVVQTGMGWRTFEVS